MEINFNELANSIKLNYENGKTADEIARKVSKLVGKKCNFTVINFFLNCSGSFADRDDDIVYDYYTNKLTIYELSLKYDTSQQEVYRVIKESNEYKKILEDLRIEKSKPDIDIDEVIKLYKKNEYTLYQIGTMFGKSSTYIKNILVNKGVYNFRQRRS